MDIDHKISQFIYDNICMYVYCMLLIVNFLSFSYSGCTECPRSLVYLYKVSKSMLWNLDNTFWICGRYSTIHVLKFKAFFCLFTSSSLSQMFEIPSLTSFNIHWTSNTIFYVLLLVVDIFSDSWCFTQMHDKNRLWIYDSATW